MNTNQPLPALFVSHGAPSYALEPGIAGPQLQALGHILHKGAKPSAILIVSPHWMTQGLSVSTAPLPDTIYDFGGFEDALYSLKYPSPGAPEVASKVAALLQNSSFAESGYKITENQTRGLDHGAWVPLRYLFPEADIPTFQLSLPRAFSAEDAYRLGQTLAPLRYENILIIGSGSLTHNLYEFRGQTDKDAEYAVEFADWIKATIAEGDARKLVQTLEIAPHAKRAHPTSEHFLPLLIAAGAASTADDKLPQSKHIAGGISYGILSMDSYVFGALPNVDGPNVDT